MCAPFSALEVIFCRACAENHFLTHLSCLSGPWPEGSLFPGLLFSYNEMPEHPNNIVLIY
jgi:hypothetical protein